MGGGSLMTPLLIILLGVKPITAIGTDLVYMSITKSFGSLQHYKQGSIDFTIVKYLLIGGVPFTFIGFFLISYINSTFSQITDNIIRYSLSTVLLCAGLIIIYMTVTNKSIIKTNLSTQIKKLENKEINSSKKFQTVLIGATIAFMVSFTSVGSGVLLMPFLLLVYKIIPRRLVGSDILFAFIITTLSGLSFLFIGEVDIILLLLLSIGSIPGVIVGSKLSNRISPKILRTILGLVIISTTIPLIIQI